MESTWRLPQAADMSAGWDWNDFWSTTLATLAGVAVSAIVGWLIFRGQRVDRYQERVSDALVRFLGEVTARITALDQYKVDMVLAGQTDRNQPAPNGKFIPSPSQWAIYSSMRSVIMVARGHDATLIDAARLRMGDTLHFGPDEEIAALGNISTGISQYRAGLWPLDKCIERIKTGRQIDRSDYAPEEKPHKPKRRHWPRSL